MTTARAFLRCDLHVHSRFSGPFAVPGLRSVALECYAEPREVHDAARRRGMDLVTLTDHDTVEGALALRGLPGTFVSEEVTCELGGGRSLHLGVYGLDERQHAAIQARRADPPALFGFLAEQRLPTALHHPFSALTGRREPGDLEMALDRVRLLETRNGAMSEAVNGAARRAARAWSHGEVGGSDAHVLSGVASAFTVVPGAAGVRDFLDGLRAARCMPGGRHGGLLRLSAAVARILGQAAVANASAPLEAATLARRVAGLGLAPAALLSAPVVAAVYAYEQWFARRHARALLAGARRAIDVGVALLGRTA